jgi:signal peptidase II
VLLTMVIAGADLETKWWARSRLAGGELSGADVRLRLVNNRGASWGFGSSTPTLVAGLEIAGVLVLGWLLLTRADRGERACLAVVLGGAIGNLSDRLARGTVTDWIHFPPYPPYFNVADVAIRIGLLALAAMIFARRSRSLRTQAAMTATSRRARGEQTRELL